MRSIHSVTPAALVVALLLTAGCLDSSADNPPVTGKAAMAACDDEGADPWIADFRDRVLKHSALARYSIERFAGPIECSGTVNDLFDGQKFGTLELVFGGVTTLRIETFPPEASRTTLRVPLGFESEQAARRLLRSYVEKVGVALDWANPSSATDGPERIERFEPAEPGWNTAAELIFTDGRLTALRFSLAL